MKNILKKIIYTLILILPIAVKADIKKKYVGTQDGSTEALTELCLDYMQRGFLENNVDYFLHLVPAKLMTMEKKLLKSFENSHNKRFKGLIDNTFSLLKVKTPKRFVYKGINSVRISVNYQGNGVKKKFTANCLYEESDNGTWYFGRLP